MLDLRKNPGLVLSLFPGIDLFGRAFHAEGFCVVLGPDPAMGSGDIRDFHPARGFTGIIGGPPCQDFSKLRRCAPTGEGLEMLHQFKRCVQEASPVWWLMENVPSLPDVTIDGYTHQRLDLRACEFGLRQSRLRHFQFGHRFGRTLVIPRGRAIAADSPCVTASEGTRQERRTWEEFCQLQGLPGDFKLPYFHRAGRYRAVGNAVPLPVGRALAAAIAAITVRGDNPRACACSCGRPVSGKRTLATARCRKVVSRRRQAPAGPSLVPVLQSAPPADSHRSAPESEIAVRSSPWIVARVDRDFAAVTDPGTGTTYPGSKAASGLSERIIRQMPPHRYYIEAFAGHAAVGRKKRPADRSIFIDEDPKVCGWLFEFFGVPAGGNQVLCGDALEILPTLAGLSWKETLVYFDPPYLMETRTRLLYEHEFETREHHQKLLEFVLKLECMVMISGYRSSLYESMLQSWRKVEIPAMTRGGMRTECLWCNFAEPAVLHDPRFAGADYRERERIGRKAKRWARKFGELEARERQAVAAALAISDRTSMEAALADGAELLTQV